MIPIGAAQLALNHQNAIVSSGNNICYSGADRGLGLAFVKPTNTEKL